MRKVTLVLAAAIVVMGSQSAWTVIADGTTENYDCRLFLPSLSGVGNLLTVRNTGTTRVQLSPCRITAPPC